MKYNKDVFKEDLEKGCVFDFKSNSWVILLSCFSFVIFVPIGIFYFTFSLPSSLTFGTIIGGLFVLMAFVGLITGIMLNNRKIEIDPETIKWSGGFSSGKVKFVDIEDISFFPSAFFNLNTAKLFLYKGEKHKIRTSLMKSPKNWYSEEMIRTIIDHYWKKANPDAIHSAKYVSSTPSPGGKKFSLTKPRISQQDGGSAPQGYKCPNCLVIHDTREKFCPKCGFRMG